MTPDVRNAYHALLGKRDSRMSEVTAMSDHNTQIGSIPGGGNDSGGMKLSDKGSAKNQ